MVTFWFFLSWPTTLEVVLVFSRMFKTVAVTFLVVFLTVIFVETDFLLLLPSIAVYYLIYTLIQKH
ncbi:hypothetical protein ACQKL0_01730 [Peribacillus sp. NPDC097264]|uniref:hypothetical protein n=1 Tax=Peribacillus sp. NPDC097264 TaxID=3390616 RepID=UPI003D00694F